MSADTPKRPPLFVEGYLDDLYRAGRAPHLMPPAQALPDAGDRVMPVETCLAAARPRAMTEPAARG